MPKDLFSFDYSKRWPSNERFPLNLEPYENRNVEQAILKDIANSNEYLIITGFTSLNYLIDLFHKEPTLKDKKIRIVLGFEPIARQRKKWPIVDFPTAVKDYWLEKGISPLQSGGVIALLDHIENDKAVFKISDKIHAKIYVGEQHAILGSSNLSYNGLLKQSEANIRVENDKGVELKSQLYEETKLIAENFYSESKGYKKKMIELLELLLKLVDWQEALARAISELLEGDWMKNYPDAFNYLDELELWPTQKAGIGQALHIIDNQGSVLIADPTGSGKTKLVSSIQLALISRRWMTGRGGNTNSRVICPPIVIDNWNSEYLKMKFSQQSPLSNGILSYEGSKKHDKALEQLKQCHIIIIDEAHNYLNPRSTRSLSLKNSQADCVILVTATPINKKADDLLRLIELLDIDNLNDEELKQYIELKRRRGIENLSDFELLKDYIKKFTVRRTKKQLNEAIQKQPNAYLNVEGNKCKFPEHICEIYDTQETGADREKARQIEELASSLKGLINLRNLRVPVEAINDAEKRERALNNRLITAKALAKYHIQAKLRSSKVALVEHIEGTKKATELFNFESTKSITGNILSKLEKAKDSLPNSEYESSLMPKFLEDLEEYGQACEEEIQIYRQISSIAKSMSDARESGKVEKINELFKKHDLILAFDSTILSLDYLKHLINQEKYDFTPHVVTGEKATAKEKVKEIFGIGSKEINHLALCSDSMAEGVNLQQASAIVLLDMPSVLRIAEQRIGRLDRMDSPHKKIYAHWPNDSKEFALKADKKLVKTNLITDQIIGSNLDLPEELLGKHMDEIISTDEMIKEFENVKTTSDNWDGIHDAFQPVRELVEGEEAIIESDTYDYYKEVSAKVRCRVSIVRGDNNFGFFAIRGTETRAPQWFFIGADNKVKYDLATITKELKIYLKDVKSEQWNKQALSLMKGYIAKLEEQEVELLPNKKKRAFKLLLDLLRYYSKKAKKDNFRRKKLVDALLKELESGRRADLEDMRIDFQSFMNHWLDIIQPELTKIKQQPYIRIPRTISDLLRVFKKKPLANKTIEDLRSKIPYIDKIENRIAACIIGISE